MAEVNVERGLYLDMNAKDEDGNFGVYREGFRDPETHTIRFDEGEAAQAEKPAAAAEPAPKRVSVAKPEDDPKPAA